MKLQEPFGGLANMRRRRIAVCEFRKLRIGQEGRIGFRQMMLEQAVKIFACKMEEAGIVEIVEFTFREVEPVDGDGGLAVFFLVAHPMGIGHIEAVHLDQADAAAFQLRLDMVFHPVEDRKFGGANAIKCFEIFQRHLEEGELVAFEILCQGETEHGFRG
ncbi:hypothetical protein D3C78_1443280 [compost metagenome]